METNITRRRVLQGVGAAGVIGVAGNTIVGAQQGGDDQNQSTAIRVAHASPDAPPVDVRLSPVQDGTAANESVSGTDNETIGDDGTTGNESDGGGASPGGGDQDGPLIEGLEFRSVSDYQEVDPGTYQLQIVATEQTGLLESIFGGGDGEERIVFDQEVEVEAGTTYTAVAYGELAQADLGPGVETGNQTVGNDTGQPGDLGNETAPADNETGLPGADNETAPADEGNETAPIGAGNETTPAAGNETSPPDGFGNETAGNETLGDETQAPGEGQVVVEELQFGESETFTAPAGDYTLEIYETTASADGDVPGTPGDVGNETVGDDNVTVGDDNVTGLPDETDNETTPAGEDDETAPIGADNETAGTDNETSPIGDETGNETVGTGDEALGVGMDQGGDQAFTVDILEDDLSAPSDEQSRVRVFHAVPDADAVRIVAVESEGDDGGGLFGGGDDNATADDQTGDNVTAGGMDNDTVGDDAGVPGQDNGTVDDGAVGQDNETAGDGVAGDPAQTADVSLEAGVAYSAFALGYFDPQAAAQDGAVGNETGSDNVTIGGAGNDTAGGMDNDSVGDGVGGAQDNETGNDTVGQDAATPSGNETGGGDGMAADAEGEAFELVVVEDATDGERADGGTGGGGLLPDAAAPEAASD